MNLNMCVRSVSILDTRSGFHVAPSSAPCEYQQMLILQIHDISVGVDVEADAGL